MVLRIRRLWIPIAAALVAIVAIIVWALAQRPPPFTFLEGAIRVTYPPDPLSRRSSALESTRYRVKSSWDVLVKKAKAELQSSGYKLVFYGQEGWAQFYGPRSYVDGRETIYIWKGNVWEKYGQQDGWVSVYIQATKPEGGFASVLRWLKLR
jgi:hypothetical protein